MRKASSLSGSRKLAAAISTILTMPAIAQEPANVLDAVTVTATRRTESIQDVPLNIAAVSSDLIETRGITDLAELSRSVPGLFVIDQGPRAANAIIVRGLNADPIGGTEALGNGGGGTVATYIGEIPLYVDLKPVDMQRMEILLGPQGTLYGAGTMGGAIRYLPNRPQFDSTTVELRADGYTLSQSDGVGASYGFTVNLPITDSFAFRAAAEYLDDPGFIDYNFLVRNPGASDPEPNFADPAAVAANLYSQEDTDFEKTLSGRAALRWQITGGIDANLTYYYQDQEVGGRSLNQQASFDTGRYESAQRYLEPNDRNNQLGALEVSADLGFAELTSATGYSKFTELGQRDQTDLLIALETGYEAFPTFSAYTREEQEDKVFNQEFRLVSNSDGRWGWIVGAFYNHAESDASSMEFTPLFSEYLVSGGAPGGVRTDALEYLAVDASDLKEYAVYGELAFDVTAKWQVTVGGRWYKYDLATKTATDLPLVGTTYEGDRGPTDVVLEFENGGQKDDGFLYKFNTRYEFTDDVMAYLTVSEGYRIGNSNGLALCDGTTGVQNVCASEREFQYFADSVTNYEIGLRTQFFDHRLTLNGSVFFLDWQDPQLSTSTAIGAAPIVINGEGAATKGVELTFDARLTEHLTISGSYSYVKAELSKDAPDLIRGIVPPGFGVQFDDGLDGDRLPGSPEQQGSLYATYSLPVADSWQLDFNYGVNVVSDVLTRAGARGGGESIPGFTLHSASIVLSAEQWTAALYAKNLFDKYAVTGVRVTRDYIQTVADENGDPVHVRSYSNDVVRPLEVGLRLMYKFDL